MNGNVDENGNDYGHSDSARSGLHSHNERKRQELSDHPQRPTESRRLSSVQSHFSVALGVTEECDSPGATRVSSDGVVLAEGTGNHSQPLEWVAVGRLADGAGVE